MKDINKCRNFLLAVIGIAGFAVTFVNAQQIDGKGPVSLAPTSSTQNVKVVNTSTEPVPVAVTGTPTVQIGNTAANPVLVRDLDSAGRQPYRAQLSVSFSTIDQGSEAQNTLAVPAGKRLVIKYISALISLPPDQVVTGDITAGTGIQFNPVSWFVLNLQANGGGLNAIYIASQPVELYLDPGTEFFAEFYRSSSVGTGYGRIIISGYLVDVP